ncbi:hypothetical protein, partial [Enterobacter hormaechei]|uniref:hypothetical protein n=1 Tax=Enterobacter hormaechei TaxID=158836 RepID=UPI00197AE611
CSTGRRVMIQKIPLDQVPAAFGKIENQFVGILVAYGMSKDKDGSAALTGFRRFPGADDPLFHRPPCHDSEDPARSGACRVRQD